MSNFNQVTGSGDGTRPTTSGGVDNIGAGEKFVGHQTKAGDEVSSPAAAERMSSKRKDVESARHDDSAPFFLTEDAESEPNREPVPAPANLPANQP